MPRRADFSVLRQFYLRRVSGNHCIFTQEMAVCLSQKLQSLQDCWRHEIIQLMVHARAESGYSSGDVSPYLESAGAGKGLSSISSNGRRGLAFDSRSV
jgi:hypothetical protein